MSSVPALRRNRLVAGVLVLLLPTLIAFAPAFGAGYIWDDDHHITENETLRSPDGLRRIWVEPTSIPQYYPLVHTLFWLEYRLWGDAPLGYHLVNVLLHFLNAVLVWLVLRRLLPHLEPRPDAPLLMLGPSWLAAAIFALHPVHVESVVWVTERKNVLSGTFYLAALLVLLPVFGLGGVERTDRTGRRLYLAGFALFVAALLSKSVTCSLPAALLLLVYWKRGRIGRDDLLLTAPMFVVGLVAGLHTAYLEKVHVGAQQIDWGLSAADRLLVAGRAVFFYAGKLLWPQPLIFNYPRWTIDASEAWQWIFPFAAVGVVGALFLARRRLGRGPLVAVLFFGGTLVPALGFVDVYPMLFSWVADHFQYLASLGPIVLVVAALATLGQRLPGRRAAASYALSALLLGGLGVLTFRQSLTYWDAETLWRTTLERNPDSWMAMDNLAALLAEREREEGTTPRAAVLRREIAALRERSLELYQDAQAYEALGEVRLQQGRWEEAAELFRDSLELGAGNASARLNLSTALGRLGRRAEQAAELERLLTIAPDFVPAIRNLASLLLDAADPELYDPERARQLAERACELTGWRDPMQMILLAEAEVQLGDAAEAVRIVDRALAVAEQGGAPASLRRALRAKRSEYAGKRTREGGSR